VARGWGRLHNEELHNLYTSTDIIRGKKDDEMGGESRANGKIRSVYKFLVGKPEGKRALVIPMHRWGGNIRMDLMEIGWEYVDWIHVAQEGSCGHGNEPLGSIEGREFVT
jgi:hypothetical protein